VARLLPENTIKILERELKNRKAPGKRNFNLIKDKMNKLSRADFIEIAYFNAKLINSIIKMETIQYRKPNGRPLEGPDTVQCSQD